MSDLNKPLRQEQSQVFIVLMIIEDVTPFFFQVKNFLFVISAHLCEKEKYYVAIFL